MLRVVGYVLLLSVLPAAVPARAAWSVARNEHFEVYSQNGPGAAREALLWFEQLRVFFQQQTGLSPVPPSRLRVIGFGSVKEYQAYNLRPGTDAYYAGYGDDSFIVMPGLYSRQRELAAHEYVHALLHTRGGQLPAWLNEGLADVYSTVRVSERGSTVGEAAQGRLAFLRRSSPIPLQDLLAAGSQQFQGGGRESAGAYYAQSWALTHLLLFSPEYRGRFGALLSALAGGQESGSALEQVYGRPVGAISRGLGQWLGQAKFAPVPLAAVAQPAEQMTVEDVPAFLIRRLLADLVFTLGDLPRAADLYTELARESPADAKVAASLGAVALRQGNKSEARRHWQRALSLGVTDAMVCYRYAVLAQDAGEPADAVRPALERAVALRPDFDDARYTLGLLEANAGREETAVAQLRAMRTVAPERAFSYWCALADSLLGMGNREEAKEAAAKAAKFARDAGQKQRAAQIVYLAETDLTVQFTRDQDGRVRLATTRVSRHAPRWNPFIETGDRVVRTEGILREVRCEDVTRLVIEREPGAPPLVLSIPDLSRVQMQNAPPEFTCGVQEPGAAVKVEYAERPVATEAGVVRGVEFAAGATSP